MVLLMQIKVRQILDDSYLPQSNTMYVQMEFIL